MKKELKHVCIVKVNYHQIIIIQKIVFINYVTFVLEMFFLKLQNFHVDYVKIEILLKNLKIKIYMLKILKLDKKYLKIIFIKEEIILIVMKNIMII